MKIGRRLTLQFTLIVGLIFISVLLSVYLLSLYNTQYIFYERLKERVFITSNIFFEKEELKLDCSGIDKRDSQASGSSNCHFCPDP